MSEASLQEDVISDVAAVTLQNSVKGCYLLVPNIYCTKNKVDIS